MDDISNQQDNCIRGKVLSESELKQWSQFIKRLYDLFVERVNKRECSWVYLECDFITKSEHDELVQILKDAADWLIKPHQEFFRNGNHLLAELNKFVLKLDSNFRDYLLKIEKDREELTTGLIQSQKVFSLNTGGNSVEIENSIAQTMKVLQGHRDIIMIDLQRKCDEYLRKLLEETNFFFWKVDKLRAKLQDIPGLEEPLVSQIHSLLSRIKTPVPTSDLHAVINVATFHDASHKFLVVGIQESIGDMKLTLGVAQNRKKEYCANTCKAFENKMKEEESFIQNKMMLEMEKLKIDNSPQNMKVMHFGSASSEMKIKNNIFCDYDSIQVENVASKTKSCRIAYEENSTTTKEVKRSGLRKRNPNITRIDDKI